MQSGTNGERFNKAFKRANKNAKRNSKRVLSSLEAEKNPEQAISTLGEVAKPSELGDRLDPLTAAVAAEQCLDMALETMSSQSSLGAVSRSQREGEWQETNSLPIIESPWLLECGVSSSYSVDVAHEMERFEYVQQDEVKAISVTEKDMKLGVSSTGLASRAIESLEQTCTEHRSKDPRMQAPKLSFDECFQTMSLAAEIAKPLRFTMNTKVPQPIAIKKAITRPEKVLKPLHPNCTRPRTWLADETLTMPMPDYPEPYEPPSPLHDEVPKRPVLTDTAKKLLLAQFPHSQIIVHHVDNCGFTSFLAPIKAPDRCTLVPEFLVSTSTLCIMGFYIDAAEKIWRRYLRNPENRSMEDSYTLLFYTQRFIEETYTTATSSLEITDSDKLMEKWSLVSDFKAAIRREARAKDVANSWRHSIKIADLQHLKAVVMKKVNEKFRALDKLSYEIEWRKSKKQVSLIPMGDSLERKARGINIPTTHKAEGLTPLARMLEY